MAIQQDKKNKEKKNDLSKPDEETLHTTDPQEEMEGPISSVMQNIKENAEENDEETKEEADKKQGKNK
jgi:hypothetical protein